MFTSKDHTFCLCAYKTSEYLEECILSLKKQSVQSNIIISTSTPNEHIYNLAQKYNIRVYVNEGEKGISGDWNAGVKQVSTPLITIAHQDDIYEKEYLEEILKGINNAKDPIIAFSHYAELRENTKVYKNRNLNIKKVLLSPIIIFKKSKFVRRRSLSLGCAICCPAVTYVKAYLDKFPFQKGFKSDLDWQQWEVLSRQNGSFVYIPKPLMCHRVHEDSATTEIIGDNLRTKEDFEMFKKFWPLWIAKIINKAYSKSEESNNL